MESMSKQMQAIQGVYSVTAPVEMTNCFVQVQRSVTKVGRGIVLVLMVVSIITVGSTIRLSVFARRREIEIMKYVGATNGLVTLPFVVEGLAMGLISGVLTAAISLGGYSVHGAGLRRSGRRVGNDHGSGTGAGERRLVHYHPVQPHRRCRCGWSGQYVLHPQAPERVIERSRT